MKLYNTINKPLRWDINMTSYSCEPYGEVIVPDMFVEHCKARGLPLSSVPTAPEVRAGKIVEEASKAAKQDEVLGLTKQLSEATAAEKVAKSEVEKLLAKEVEYKSKIAGLELDNNTVKSQLDKVTQDFSALDKLTTEQATKLEVLQQDRDRAFATLEELSKAKTAEVKPETKPNQAQSKQNNK